VGAGVTGYGIAYLVVHDLFIHERLGRLPGARSRYVRWVATAHAVHHRSGRKPYGFLLPRLVSASATSSTSVQASLRKPASRPSPGCAVSDTQDVAPAQTSDVKRPSPGA
jgi:beta-carotene 3-hydroxylase